MKVMVKVEFLRQLVEQVESLQNQLNSLDSQREGFDLLDSDGYLIEVYNS